MDAKRYANDLCLILMFPGDGNYDIDIIHTFYYVFQFSVQKFVHACCFHAFQTLCKFNILHQEFSQAWTHLRTLEVAWNVTRKRNSEERIFQFCYHFFLCLRVFLRGIFEGVLYSENVYYFKINSRFQGHDEILNIGQWEGVKNPLPFSLNHTPNPNNRYSTSHTTV